MLPMPESCLLPPPSEASRPADQPQFRIPAMKALPGGCRMGRILNSEKAFSCFRKYDDDDMTDLS